MIYDSDNPDCQLDNLRDVVNTAVMKLQPHVSEFDSIAVRGTSGILVGAPVALAMGKPLVVIRKPAEDAHTGRHVNLGRAGARYVFLDDFVASGATRRAVAEAIADAGGPAGPYATYSYEGESWDVHGPDNPFAS